MHLHGHRGLGGLDGAVCLGFWSGVVGARVNLFLFGTLRLLLLAPVEEPLVTQSPGGVGMGKPKRGFSVLLNDRCVLVS